MDTRHFDAAVIGSGVGGMCAAALLAFDGLRVLLAEKRRYLGGRFSTVNHDGYLCATGGLAVPVGHNLEQVCAAVGIPSGVVPSRRTAVWLAGEWFDLSEGSTRAIVKRVAETEAEARAVLGALRDARGGELPAPGLSFRDWLERYTRNPRIHGLFQATISSLLTVNAWELPAAEYFRVMNVIAPLTFGFVEGGSLALWERMAELVRARGGEVWTGTAVQEIRVAGGRPRGLRLRRDGADLNVDAPIVVSNVGPAATAGLVTPGELDPGYVRGLQQSMTPTAIMWLHFCSDEALFDYSAVSVGCSRRVNMIDAPSMELSGLAPPGRHLYTVGAAPRNSLDPGDLDVEFAEVMKDLDDVIPDFRHRCRLLTRTCYRGKWPGFRTVPGQHAGHRTPVANLYNVGDAASPSGYEGSMGAACSAQQVYQDICRSGLAEAQSR